MAPGNLSVEVSCPVCGAVLDVPMTLVEDTTQYGSRMAASVTWDHSSVVADHIAAAHGAVLPPSTSRWY